MLLKKDNNIKNKDKSKETYNLLIAIGCHRHVVGYGIDVAAITAQIVKHTVNKMIKHLKLKN